MINIDITEEELTLLTTLLCLDIGSLLDVIPKSLEFNLDKVSDKNLTKHLKELSSQTELLVKLMESREEARK